MADTPREATYVAANQFKVSGNQEARYPVGVAIQAYQGVDGLDYSTVKTVAYRAGTDDTLVTVDDGVLTTNLTGVLHGNASTISLPKMPTPDIPASNLSEEQVASLAALPIPNTSTQVGYVPRVTSNASAPWELAAIAEGGGGGGTGGAISETFTQTSHGFVVGDLVSRTGLTDPPLWETILGNPPFGFVTAVDGDDFTVTFSGPIDITGWTDDQSATLTVSGLYFPSLTVSGKVSSTDASITLGPDFPLNPCLYVLSATRGLVISCEYFLFKPGHWSAEGGLCKAKSFFRSELTPTGTGIQLVSGTAYFVYLGCYNTSFYLPQFIDFFVSVAGVGTQVAEVGLFTNGSPCGDVLNLMRICSSTIVDSLLTTGVKRNTTGFSSDHKNAITAWTRDSANHGHFDSAILDPNTLVNDGFDLDIKVSMPSDVKIVSLTGDGTGSGSVELEEDIASTTVSAITPNIALGAYFTLWAGIRVTMGTTQPTILGLGGDYGEGFILKQDAAPSFVHANDATGWTGSIITPATGAQCPDLRMSLV